MELRRTSIVETSKKRLINLKSHESSNSILGQGRIYQNDNPNVHFDTYQHPKSFKQQLKID